MNKGFVRLINEDGTIKVYKNNIISANLLHPSEECSYYDEQIYNVYDLINQNEQKDKEIERHKNIINDIKDYVNFLVIINQTINGKFNETQWGQDILGLIGDDNG